MSKKLIKFTLMLIAGIFGLMCIQMSWAADPASAGLQAWSFPEKSLMLSQSSSVAVLVQLFGPLVQLIVDPSGIPLNIKGYLFADVLSYWNFFISSSAAAFISYHLILGFVKSSENGRFLGREDEKVGTIMRFCMGGFLVAPVIKGKFCMMQILFMGWILVGVNAANKVWRYATYDISMGVTPTIPASVTQTINQLIGQMYLYRTVDYYLQSEVKEVTVTSTGTSLVDLEDQPGFESVANAVLNKHSYHMWAMQGAKSPNTPDSYQKNQPFFNNLQYGAVGDPQQAVDTVYHRRLYSWCKDNYNFTHSDTPVAEDCKPDASQILDYQVGSWVVASNGIVWKGGVRDEGGVDNIVGPSNRRLPEVSGENIAGFERAVLMDNGSTNQSESSYRYNIEDGSIHHARGPDAIPSGLNAREAALIAPLGFTTKATPTNTNFPILAGPGPMYVRSPLQYGLLPATRRAAQCPCNVDTANKIGNPGATPGDGICWSFGGKGTDKSTGWYQLTGGIEWPYGMNDGPHIYIFKGYTCKKKNEVCALINVGGYQYGCLDIHDVGGTDYGNYEVINGHSVGLQDN